MLVIDHEEFNDESERVDEDNGPNAEAKKCVVEDLKLHDQFSFSTHPHASPNDPTAEPKVFDEKRSYEEQMSFEKLEKLCSILYQE